LARYEAIPEGTFTRKGKPDAGVECFWTLPDGSEWGWQAKYFVTSPTSSQWGQVDHSVKRFLETHPRMTTFTIAMPYDLPDARKDNQESALEKWNDHVEKWQGWAADQGRTVEFEYWGASEIVDRLSQDQHCGRVFFWFQRDYFSAQWFMDRIGENIADAGPRYTPELDVELPIAQVFDGLGRTDAFYARLKGWVSRIRKNLLSIGRVQELFTEIDKALQELQGDANALCQALSAIDEKSVATIDYSHILQLLEQAQAKIRVCRDAVAEEAKHIRANANRSEQSSQYQSSPTDWIRNVEYDLHRLDSDLIDLNDYLEDKEATAANVGALLLVGEAGKGKTHLFCDVAERRNQAELPTVLLLGEHFADNVWSHILERLDLPGRSRAEMLGALEASAQVKGRKALILIDALNEGADLTIWRNRLRSFLQILARYEWISVAISVRSSYEDLVIPADLGEDQLVRLEHQGFTGVEYEATRRFFDHYNIEQPSIPLLNPEFQTPLFLKVFCKGLANKGLARIPRGRHGITAIFNFFVDSIYDRIRPPDRLNLSPHSDIVWDAISRITDLMARRTTDWLPAAEAERVVNAGLPQRGYTNSLFYHLLSEGLLAKDCFRTKEDGLVEGVRFAYQRLADHLITQHLLDRYLTDEPAEAFETDTPLRALVYERESWWRPYERGLIEALSIQIPERTGRELVTLVPDLEKSWYICQAFVESVLWRNPGAFSDETLDCVNQCTKFEDLTNRFLSVLLTVAVDPAHPYNADFLHRRLMRDEMADRDAWWSIFLYEQYEEQGAVDRLVDWAWASNDKSHIEDESIHLCGVALAWFLTTSHRFLRDQATKALVNLLTDRLGVLRRLLEQFQTVNDLYVLERLLAVAYGCAMRSADDEEIEALAQDIYDWLFSEGNPPAHILLRDYACGVIEYALHRGLSFSGDMSKIRPPYQSNWIEIQTEEEIEALKAHDGSWNSTDGSWAHNRILWSVREDDFSHYVIGRRLDWLSLRLDEPRWQSEKEICEQFFSSFTKEQKEAWLAYQRASEKVHDQIQTILSKILASLTDEELQVIAGIREQGDESELAKIYRGLSAVKQWEVRKSHLNESLIYAEEQFIQTLDDVKADIYKTVVQRFIEDPGSRGDPPRFEQKKVQRWIIQRVFDLGWSIERFGWFDHHVARHNPRSGYKPERIGKKYQWLAYHEILARIADNFQFCEKYSNHVDKQQYKGAWQVRARDIDPSCILRSKEDEDLASAWWEPVFYSNWDDPVDDAEWLRSVSDLPDPVSLIDVVEPCDGSHWLNLYGFYKWTQPAPFDQDRYAMGRRDIFYLLQGYLVCGLDIDSVYNWAAQQDFYGRWMPEGREFIDLYLGELYWSSAYEYHNDPYMGSYGWRKARQEIPAPILPLSERYLAEYGTFDCSIDDTYSITVPVEHLVQGMRLRWSGSEARFVDEAGQLTAFDPSTQESGPSALLVRRESFLEFLEDQNYAVLWTLLGEKNLVGGGIGPDNWKGRLVISAAYQVVDREISGGLSTTFRSP